MEQQPKRRNLEEIYADMDKVNKRRPTRKHIEELGEVVRRIYEGEQVDKAKVTDKKIARPREIHGNE